MVMRSYTENWGRGSAWDEHPMIVAPPGTHLGQMDAQSLFSEITTALSLKPIGVYTPWATREGDVSWTEIHNPDTNIMLWGLTDAAVNAVPEVTFGSPLPFVAILTKAPLSVERVRGLWNGTAYAPYETQAVYRQDDAKSVPTLYFLHWGERIDMSKLPGQVLLLEPTAAKVDGALVFAAQIPSQGSTTREPPSLSFDQAFQSTVPVAPGPAPARAPAPIPIVRAPEEKMNIGIPVAVFLGSAALGFVIWRARQ